MWPRSRGSGETRYRPAAIASRHRGGEGGVAYLRLGIVSVRAAQVDDPGGGERLETVQIGVALAGHLVDDDQEAVHHHLRETLAIRIDIARER